MSRDDTLVILLPGAYDTPADFVTHGFDTLAATAGLTLRTHPTDLNAVVDGSLVHALHAEVVQPARAAGHARIVLGGISIGALTAMTYQDTYPGTVDGLALLAPYPGNRSITRTIEASGGLAGWTPGPLQEIDGELRGWRALQALARTTPSAIWLGYGEQDRFAGGHALMAAVLPPTQVHTTPGGHDWPTWRRLWQAMLGAGLGR